MLKASSKFLGGVKPGVTVSSGINEILTPTFKLLIQVAKPRGIT